MKKCIGILGGTGDIGQKCIENLKREFKIIASYCNTLKQSDRFCIYEKVDINETSELKKFCEKCDLIINCAGASYKNGEKVARITNKLNIPYIDPSGESFLEEKLKDIEYNNIFVLSSGFFPGLSGLVMDYVCKSFDYAISIEGFSLSEEVPSYSAIEDFILTNLSGFGRALSSYESGKIINNQNVVIESVDSKLYKLKNYLTNETIRVANKYKLKEANWYNCSFGEDVIKKMQEVILKIKNHDENYKNLINEVVNLFENKVNEDSGFSYLKITGTGIKDNCKKIKIIEAKSNFSSEMSAIVVAYTARIILEENFENGIYYAMDIIDLEKIISELSKLNMNLKITDKEENMMNGDYEDGEI